MKKKKVGREEATEEKGETLRGRQSKIKKKNEVRKRRETEIEK